MQGVGQSDTTPEIRLRKPLWRSGSRYRINRRIEGVRPDFCFLAQRVAVFVDGCFWHGCPRHYSAPRKNSSFWKDKVERNRARDRRDTKRLCDAGWQVLRFWECEVNEELDACLQQVRDAVYGESGEVGEHEQ